MGDGKRSTSSTKYEAAGKSHRAKRCNTANEVQKLVLGGLFLQSCGEVVCRANLEVGVEWDL